MLYRDIIGGRTKLGCAATPGNNGAGRSGETEFSAVAMDFDGTIRSTGGVVPTDLRSQLEALRRRGVRLILVTGRALEDLSLLVDTGLFDALIVENGAISVVDGVETNMAPESWWPKRDSLLRALRTTGHEKVIIALRREQRQAIAPLVDDTIRIELNKDAVMLMPTNISKGACLERVLETMGLESSRVMAVGDGENDISMFRVVGLAVAVGNAVPALVRVADYVTEGAGPEGVSEAISKFYGPREPSGRVRAT